jgi:hypothetical protein
MRLLILVACAALSASQAPTISLNPRIVLAGNSMRMTCRIVPTDATRFVSFGISGLRSSGRQVDGADGVRTYEFLVDRVPCKVGPAFCITTDNANHQESSTLSFEIAGCEP